MDIDCAIEFVFSLKSVSMIDLVVDLIAELNYKE
jgi:hypothetical protein